MKEASTCKIREGLNEDGAYVVGLTGLTFMVFRLEMCRMGRFARPFEGCVGIQ